MTHTCDLPPRKPAIISHMKKKPALAPAPAAVATCNLTAVAPASPVIPATPASQNVNVHTHINIKAVPSRNAVLRTSRPANSVVYRVKPRKPFYLGLVIGSTPTQHKVGTTDCNFSISQCKVEVSRKRVIDFGQSGSYSFSSGLQIGAVGTAQGNFYASVGFNF